MEFLAQLSEFIGNHILLVGALIILIGLLIYTESRQGGASVTPKQAVNLINREDAVVLDIRDKKKFSAGHITGAKNIPFAGLEKQIPSLKSDLERPVLIVCDSGQTAGPAAKLLIKEAFQTYRLSGGMMAWQGDSLPVVK